MRARLSCRPILAVVCCAAFLVSSACFGGQQAAQPTAGPETASPVASPRPLGSPSPAASPVGSPTPTPAPGEQRYTVEVGDTLAVIAEKFYGDPTLWRKIYDTNRSALGDNPDAIKVGTELRIPPRD